MHHDVPPPLEEEVLAQQYGLGEWRCGDASIESHPMDHVPPCVEPHDLSVAELKHSAWC